jgi:glycosyltransferase involved in cell wall biosynthesis
MFLTVFTPTYNRVNLLDNVYQSLLQQSFINFEWIVIDDGSKDGTDLLIKNFILEGKISITYYKQENKGKHFAINQGVKLAKGDLFLILDSDDKLPMDSLNIVNNFFEEIKYNKNIGGVAGRRNYSDGSIVGSKNFNIIETSSLSIKYKYKVTGDLVEVFKTEVLREFPFPEIENEKFCPEDLVWNRIAQKYKLLFFNQGIYTTQYLPDGLTSKIVKIRMTSPIASMFCYSELASYKIPLIQKIKATVNFWRFSFNSEWKFSKKCAMVNIILTCICFPIGYLMHINDKRNLK